MNFPNSLFHREHFTGQEDVFITAQTSSLTVTGFQFLKGTFQTIIRFMKEIQPYTQKAYEIHY